MIDTIPCDDSVGEITLYSDEVTVMGGPNPDFYEVWISYVAYGRALDTKSLKQFFVSQRMTVYSAEGWAAKIAKVVSASVEGFVKVTVRQRARGGIAIDATAIQNRERSAA